MDRASSSRRHTANVLGALSLVVADQMNAVLEATAALGPSAPAALTALHEFLDGGSVTQLSAVLGLSHSGTVRLVDRLSAEGLVERAGADDGRAVSVVLTRRGRRLATRVREARERSLDGVLGVLTPAEITQVATMLDKVVAAVALARAEERSASSLDRPRPWLCRLCDLDACGRAEGNCPVNNAVVSGSTAIFRRDPQAARKHLELSTDWGSRIQPVRSGLYRTRGRP